MIYPFTRRDILGLASVLPLGGAEADVAYSAGGWPPNLGNHRARLRISGKPAVVTAHVPWRRRDDAAAKHVLVIDAATGQPVTKVAHVSVTRDSCDLVFEPPTAPGEYHVYYLVHTVKPIAHAYAVRYLPAQPEHYQAPSDWQSLPKARLLDLQARTEFDSVDPMEIIATDSEVRDLLASLPDPAEGPGGLDSERHPAGGLTPASRRDVHDGPRTQRRLPAGGMEMDLGREASQQQRLDWRRGRGPAGETQRPGGIPRKSPTFRPPACLRHGLTGARAAVPSATRAIASWCAHRVDRARCGPAGNCGFALA